MVLVVWVALLRVAARGVPVNCINVKPSLPRRENGGSGEQDSFDKRAGQDPFIDRAGQDPAPTGGGNSFLLQHVSHIATPLIQEGGHIGGKRGVKTNELTASRVLETKNLGMEGLTGAEL